MTLRPFQADAVRRVTEDVGGRALLNYEMVSAARKLADARAERQGLGKTVIACALARHYAEDRVLVVAPAAMCIVWQEEMLRWAGRPASIIRTAKDAPVGATTCVASYGYERLGVLVV